MDILALLIPIAFATLMSIVKSILEKKESKRTETRLEEAEKQAYPMVSQALAEKLESLSASHEGLEEKAQELSKLIEKSQQSVMLGNLFNLGEGIGVKP